MGTKSLLLPNKDFSRTVLGKCGLKDFKSDQESVLFDDSKFCYSFHFMILNFKQIAPLRQMA
jgi:hypothetical protein